MSVKRRSTTLANPLNKSASFDEFRPSRIAAALLMAMGGVPAWAASGPGTNNITLGGGITTATSMVTNGAVTDITTSTVRGNTGFNSFGHFNVNAGNTVNLHVPAGKANLVNLVHDSRVVINGNLNGLKDGSIGGNIIFADPQGLVVGASGVVNVGSLTVTTPSPAQMSHLAAVIGNGSDTEGGALAGELMSGKYNAGAGEVSIQGKVNSAGSVNLFAASAVVGNGAQVNAGAQVFQATVNTDGLVDAAGAVRQDGSIVIVGAHDVTISGELRALMANGAGGGVVVNAPELTVESTGKIDTRALAGSQQASGNISLQANSDLGFSAVNADGSAIDDVTQLEEALKRQSKPNLGGSHSVARVDIKAGAVLDAGNEDASKAGNIRVEALAVDKQLGGYAQAHSSVDIAGSLIGKDITARSVTHVAVDSGLLGEFFSVAELQSMIDKVKLLNSGWTDERAAEHVYTLLVEAIDSSQDKGAVPPSNFSEFITLLPYATFAVAEGSSRVTVAGTADIQASGDLHLAAETTRKVDTANFSLPAITSKLPFNAGIAYGRLAGETTVEILDNASIESEDLSLLAHSQDSLKVEGTAATTRDGQGSNATTLSAAFSMAHTDLKTLASVARGAQLGDVTGDVSVTALTEQSLSNTASSKSVGQGAMGGPAVALALFDSDTRAHFDADLESADSLSVNAANLVSEQANGASVQAGAAMLDSLKAKVLSQEDFKKFTTAIGNKVKTFLGMSIKPDGQPVESELRFGSAVAVSVADHQVEARLGGGGQKVTLGGDLSVTALQQQSNLGNSAESKVLADAEKDDGTKMGISVAASYNQLTQHTRALIGNNTTITAGHIGVNARNLQTLNLAGLDRWNSLDEVFENLKTHVPGAMAIPGKLSSVYANATSNSEELGLAGSVAVLNTDIDAIAWVGDNVSLTATATGNDWQSTPYAFLAVLLDENNQENKARKALREHVWSRDAAVDISASNEIQQLAIAGNFWMTLFGNTSDGKAVGGGVNVQVSNNQASAGIGANGSVTGKRVDVSATQDELIIGITPSAGKGASVAGTGAVVVSVVNSDVNASVHNSTVINAEQVGITADHQLGLWSAAGALAVSDETSVGAGVAVNVLHTDVQALVGDNRSLRSSALGVGAAGTGNATWTVDELLVNAESTGQVGAFSVAGALARTAEEQAAQDEADANSADKGLMSSVEEIGKGVLQMIFGDTSAGLQNGIGAAKDGATSIKDTVVSVPDKIGEVLDKIKGLFDNKPDPGTGQTKQAIALAGSASVNVVGQKTRAHLGDIVLDPRDPLQKGSKVTVLALNQTNQISGSGSGAFTLAGGKRSQSSAAIAGAIAYNHLYNLTQAQLKNATLNDNDLLKVQAASAGDQVSMGLGIAAATAGDDNTSVAMSVSGGVITNTTAASVLDSTVEQRVGENQGIAVTAYDRTRTLLGGGSFSLATGSNGSATSAGGSLVLALQKNTLAADWLGSVASGFNRLDVSANSAARVLAGALAVAASTGANSNSGSGSIALVIVDNDVRAKVDRSDSRDSSLSGGEVNVNAQSVAGLSAMDGLFSQAGLTALSHTELDLDGDQTVQQIDGSVETDDDLFIENGNSGKSTAQNLFTGQMAGEAVLAVAGNLAVSGKNSAGGAVSVVYTGSDYAASLANTNVDLSGDLNVMAGNNTDVLAAAIGGAGGKETAVSGSVTAVVARGSVNASIDMAGKTLKADNLNVNAFKSGGAYSLAGNITGSSNNASVGGAISLSDMQQTAAAKVQNGTYVLTGDAAIDAGLQSRIITAALSGQVSGGGSAVGGAITFNRIADTTTAWLKNATLSAGDLSINASQPGLGASIWSIAFNLSAAGGSAGVGGAVAVNLIDAERSASLVDSDVELTGSAELGSSLDGEIWGLGVDAAGGSTAGVGGSVVVNVIDGEDQVLVDNSRLVTTGTGKTLDLDVSGGGGLTIASLTGSVKGGGTAAVGGAISVNRIGADRTALIRNSREISGFSSAQLRSGAQQNIYAIAVAGGGAGTTAVNGSFTSNVLQGTERAAIENSTLNVGALELSAAIGDRTIWSLAGAFGGAGTTAVGIADTNNIILSKRLAEVINSDLTVGGALEMASGGSSNIRSVAVGAGGAGTAAVGGSVAINVIEGEERAEIRGTTVRAGSVKVDVSRGKSDVKTLAGNAQGAGTAAVGAAIAVSTINQKRIARIVDSSLLLGAGNALVKAATDGNILTLAVAGVGGGSAGVAFSNTSNNIAAQTRAEVTNSGGTAGNLEILASDTSTIHAGSGGVAGAGSVAIGVGTAINRVDSEIHASLTGNLGSGWALRNLRVDANSRADIIAGILAGGGAGTAAVSTVAATNIIQTLTQAHIGGGAKVVAQNNIAVSARNLDSILGSAISAAGAGNAAIAALATANVVETDTKAFIDGSDTSVSALAVDANDRLLVDSGVLNNAPGDDHEWIQAEQFNPYPNLSISQHQINGLAVQASSVQQVGQIALSASLAVVPLASAAVSGVVNTTVLGGSTLGYIDAAQINQAAGAGSAQNVRVGANSHSYTAGYLAAVAGGPSAAAVGAGVDNTVISRLTQARISGAQLDSRGQTQVLAGSGQYVSTVIASIAGAIVAPGVSSSLVVLKSETEALVDGGSQLDVGSLKVSASALQRLSPNATSLTGGAVAVSGALAILYNQSVTRAWMGSDLGAPALAGNARTKVLSGGTEISALNSSGISLNVASAGGGGMAVGGSIGIAVVETTTEAGASQVDFGQAGKPLGHLSISARDLINVRNTVGAAVAGGTSVGGSANVLVANSATRATFDRASLVGSQFTLSALREGDIRMNTVTGSVGSSALGGSLGLVLLGSGATSVSGGGESFNAMDELDKDGNGSLSQADSIGQADKTGEIKYDAYQWDEGEKKYKLVSKTDSATRDRVNDNRMELGDRFEANSQSKHETVARVSNSSISTSGASSISAEDKLYSRNLAGAAVAGGAAVGGAFAVTLSNARVTAELVNGNLNAASLDISARSGNLNDNDPAVDVHSLSGSAGFLAALGAAVGVAVMNNQVNVALDGAVTTSGRLKGGAQDSQSIRVKALGAAAGGAVGAGLVLGVAAHDSLVNLDVDSAAVLKAGGDIDLSSTSQGAVELTGRGAAGGIVAGINATVLLARDQSQAHLVVGNGASLTAGNHLGMNATASPKIKASSQGISLGGYLAAGASVVDALAKANAKVSLGNNAVLTAKSADISANITRQGSASSAEVDALGISGGFGVSANAVVARALNESASLVESASDTRFNGTGGDWELRAASDVHQRARTEGYAGGLLTVGAHVAEALSDTVTQALVKGVFGGDIQLLRVSATGLVDNEARSQAGQGGLVSGAASLANTRDTGITRAQLLAVGAGGAAARFQDVQLSALHTSQFNAFVDSVNASLIGASGAHAGNTVTLTTESELVAGSKIDSYGYDQSAHAKVVKAASSDYNVKSGSGGMLDAAAAVSLSTISLDTLSRVGGNASVNLIGDFRTPEHLRISAFNDVFARDRVKLDSGGAISIAKADSKVDVTRANASVDVESGAQLQSIGDIILSASGQYDIDTHSAGKTWGLAGAAMGDSLARVVAAYDINVNSGTRMLGFGNVKFYAGQDLSGGSNQATLVARTDLWNNTAFPVVNDPGADARYQRDARVTVAAGSDINSVGDIYAHADKGYGNLVGKGIAKDLYTEALNAIGLSVERSGGSAVNAHSAVVTVNGNLNTGYFNNRSVTVEGLSYWVNGQEMTLQQVASRTPVPGDRIEVRPIVTTSDDNITFRLIEGTYSQYVSARIEQLNKQLVDYGISEIERTAMQAERNLLQQTLTKLYQEMGGTGTASLARDQKIYIFQLDPILAKPGNVRVVGDSLVGNGKLSAPGDASIRVVNKSSAFLDIRGLEIPYHEGGQLLFNNVSLTNVGEINAANRQGQANFNLIVSATSPDPVISVINSYNPQHGVAVDGLRAPAPDIYINGRIFNQRGEVSVTASYGSIYSNADVRGKTIAISAGRDFVLNSSTPFYHAGGDPAGSTGTTLQAPTTSTVAANNVVISAQYLNINGTIQSGAASWAATIDNSTSLTSRINAGRASYKRGGARYLQLSTTDARTGRLGYSYDFLTERLVMDSVEVSGGYMELTGHILSTGNGQLNVLDGYSQVRITNNSSYQLNLNTIDLGMETHGTLRINDVRTSDNQQYVWSTIYTRDYDAALNAYVVNKREGYSQGVLDAATSYVATGRDTTYNPVAGRSYVWLTGQKQTTTTAETYYKDKVWGLFPSGEGTLWKRDVWTDPVKTPIDGADYMGTGFYGTAGDIHSGSETFADGKPNSETENWTTCEAWFLWCHEKRSWTKTTTVQGEQVINRNQVRADRPINISFIGSDTGLVDINSLSDVTLLGSIFNQSGSTSITTGGSLLQNADSILVAANNLTLQAGKGIGNDGKGFAVQVGNRLSASSVLGDLALRAVGGGVHLSKLETGLGNVSLSAQGNITAANGTIIKGHALNLQSTHGSIGGSGSLINIDSGYSSGAMTGAATLTAGAVGGIFLNEVAGDLAVDQVLAGGDVHLRVASGDLLDANTTLSYDTRTLAELQALWADMGLTGPAAQAALDEQKSVLVEAGQRSYERYWQMRSDNGNVQVFDESQALLGSNQVAQLKVLGWSDEQIAQEQLRRVNEYSALHDRFDSATGYDAAFQYQLSAAETAMLDGTAAWTPEQLQFSISSALLNRGTNTQVKLEQLNIEGNNVTLEAQRIGKVLDADVLVDLGAGIGNLTAAQLAALAGAEHDDVYFDDLDDKTRLRIVQRDDLNIAARGNLSVTATGDVFLGGERDLNLYNVQGDTIHIKTNGSIESANGQNVVLRGSDVLLESSTGSIGGNGAVNISITGDLTARAQLLNLVAHGDLNIQRLTGLNGVTLGVVGGNLYSSSQMGENLLGGNIALTVDGNVGSFSDRVQLGTSGLGQQISLDIGGNAYLGGLQGAASSAGTLTFGDVSVDGLLDVGQTRDLQQNADWTVGSLVLALDNQWNMAAGTRLDSANGIFARVADQARLGSLATGNAGANIDIQARLLQANGANQTWTAANRLTLLSHADIGSPTWKVGVGGLDLDITSSQGALYLTLLDGIQGGSLTSAQAQFLTSAGNVVLDSVASQNAQVVLDGVGAVGIDTLSAELDLDLSGESLSLGSANSALGDVLVNFSGAVSADELHSATKSVRINAGGTDLGNVSAATTLDVQTTTDALRIGTGTSGGNLTLTTLAGSLANIHFGPLADPATPNVLVPSHLKSGADILVRTDGDVFGGNAEAEGLLQMFGRNLEFGRAQSLQGDVFLQADGDASQGQGNINALKVDARNDVGIVATGNLTVVNVDFGGTYSLRAGRDLTVGIGGDLNVTGVAEAGRDLTFTVGGEIDLEAIKAGRNVLVTSGGAVNLTRGVEAGGAVTITAAGGGITMGTGILSQGSFEGQPVIGDVVLSAAGAVDIPSIIAGNGSILVNGHGLTLGLLSGSGDIDLLASGAIRVGTSQSGGNQSWHADEDIGFTRLLAAGQVLLDSILDTRGNELSADQGVVINAGWRNGVAGSGSIVVDRMQAPTMSLWAGELIRVADAGIGQSADLHGQDIELYGRHTGGGQLNLAFTGSGDAIASRLVTGLQAGRVQISQFHVSDSQLQMSGGQLDIEDAQGVDRMRLQTSQAVILMDNASPAYLGGADIQLYEQDRAFSFAQNQLTSTTNAYVLHRVSTHQVLVPNFMEEHEGAGGIQYQGMTAARYGEQFLSREFTLARLASMLNAAALRAPALNWVADWDQQPASLRINLDLPEQESTSEEVSKWEI